MGNRLTKIYTRTGDDGTTGLGDGSRVAKECLRVEAYGTTDEANSAIGVVLAAAALPPAFNENLPPLKDFILPGGGPSAAACHLARTVCRRAERRCWSLARVEDVAPEVMKYLNRLSDLLFVVARVLARHEKGAETLWRRSGP
jgi:cob(I)alamin adenosyltransferase